MRSSRRAYSAVVMADPPVERASRVYPHPIGLAPDCRRLIDLTP
jgi:hypothetical protein